MVDEGETKLQPVRLVLLIIDGPKQGENEFVEFPSMDEAIAYGRDIRGDRRYQLDGIEDSKGKLLIGYDHLNELCSTPEPLPQRKYG